MSGLQQGRARTPRDVPRLARGGSPTRPRRPARGTGAPVRRAAPVRDGARSQQTRGQTRRSGGGPVREGAGSGDQPLSRPAASNVRLI